MTLPRYKEYIESRVEWLGEIPRHWNLVRLKDVAEVVNGFPFDSKLFDAEGAHALIRIRDLNARETATRYSGEFVVAAAVTSSDVLIGMDGDFNVGRWRGAEPALLNQRMCCVRSPSPTLSTFLGHALPIPLKAINDITYSTTVKHLSSLDVEKIRFAIPKADELAAIAAFLDYETAKIDTLIAEQEKLIALLAEKRQATISHAVTKGLNPNAPMKDSGMAWLGEVPAHWSVKKLRHIAEVVRGASPRPAGDPQFFVEDNDSGLNRPWVTVAEVTKDQAIYLDQVTEYLTPAGVERSQSFDAGTLIFTNSGATLGVPKVLAIDCCANDGILAFLNLSDEVNIFFLYYFLLSTTERLRTEMKQGGGQPNLNTGIVKDISFAMPPYEEQLHLVELLQAELLKLEHLGVEAGRTVALLSERRSALIAAAVTGQIDVRNTVLQAAAESPEAIAA